MRQIHRKQEFMQDRIYLTYQLERFVDIPPRKTITIFRYKWGKRRRQIIHGEVLAGWFSHANGVYVDWATQEYTYSAQNLHIWPDDDDAIIPWNQCEIFELTDDEVLRHVVMEQI